MNNISGPILDRIDIQKNVPNVDYFALSSLKSSVSSSQLRAIVTRTRNVQHKRFKDIPGINSNSQMTASMLDTFCPLPSSSISILRDAAEKYHYSARVIHKIIRLTRTIADMEEDINIHDHHLLAALSLRDMASNKEALYDV